MAPRTVLCLFLLLSGGCAAIVAPDEPVELLEGRIWEYSTDGGRTYQPRLTVEPGESVAVTARVEFPASGLGNCAALELTPNLPLHWGTRVKINGEDVTGPPAGMNYRTMQGISPQVLTEGTNTLTGEFGMRVGGNKPKELPVAASPSLKALWPEHARLVGGPIVGACGGGFFTVTCRTNIPASVALTVSAAGANKPIVLRSKPGLFHRFRADDLTPAGGELTYSLSALAPRRSGPPVAVDSTPPRTVRLPGGRKMLRIVAAGDSRSNPRAWGRAAAAIANDRPDLFVHSGDIVAAGRNHWEWDEQCFGPAKELLATVPLYGAIGNHDQNAPLYYEVVYSPRGDGRAANWSQVIDNVLLIGIDGQQDFSAGSTNARWLEKVLSASDQGFIFLFSHYPAWSSAPHGQIDSKGRPRERQAQQGREVVLPLLAKYHATAMIAGHDHCYERSEPPGGVTAITSGGAGAPLYGKSRTADKQNPHSKVFASTIHYLLLVVTGERCTMKAVTPQGKLLDSTQWTPRTRKAAAPAKRLTKTPADK